jgi:hypothetical protein
MNFDEFLTVLGLDKRLDLAAATKAGACSIQFDGQVTINIENDERNGLVHAYCIVGQAPSTQRDALFAMLLQAHMFGIATDGCTFSFQPNNDQILLFTSINLKALDSGAAVKQLESLVNQSIRWSLYLPQLLENWEEKITHAAANVTQATYNMYAS